MVEFDCCGKWLSKIEQQRCRGIRKEEIKTTNRKLPKLKSRCILVFVKKLCEKNGQRAYRAQNFAQTRLPRTRGCCVFKTSVARRENMTEWRRGEGPKEAAHNMTHPLRRSLCVRRYRLSLDWMVESALLDSYLLLPVGERGWEAAWRCLRRILTTS